MCLLDTVVDRSRSLFPEKPSAAIMDGAALFGMDPSVVRSRKSRFTYGAAGLRAFKEGVDPETRKVVAEGRPWCKGQFVIYVVAGESIEHDKPVPMVFGPLNRSAKKACISICRRLPDTNPQYVMAQTSRQARESGVSTSACRT